MYDYGISERPDVTNQWVYVSLKVPINAAPSVSFSSSL